MNGLLFHAAKAKRVSPSTTAAVGQGLRSFATAYLPDGRAYDTEVAEQLEARDFLRFFAQSQGEESHVQPAFQSLQIAHRTDRFQGLLDPLNPPRLNYSHVKRLKNIDYSPLIKRAREGDMFTVDQVIGMLENGSVRFNMISLFPFFLSSFNARSTSTCLPLDFFYFFHWSSLTLIDYLFSSNSSI